MVFSQSTGCSTCRTSNSADLVRIGVRLGVDVGPDRERAELEASTSAKALARALIGRLHDLGVERPGDGQADRLHGPHFRSQRSTSSQAALVPGHDNIARDKADWRSRWYPPDLRLFTQFRDLVRAPVRARSPCRWAWRRRPPAWPGRVSAPAADRRRNSGPRRRPGRVFAQAQARGRHAVRRRPPVLWCAAFEGGQAGDENRRLADVGAVQLFRRAAGRRRRAGCSPECRRLRRIASWPRAGN